MKYQDVLDAGNKTWMVDARKFMESGIEFAVTNLTPEAIRDGGALAQEFDYTCLHLDEANRHLYPEVQPKTLGFVHRTRVRPIRPNSN